tara:strand:+ start:929 stop:1639 length:711 start_codon:yes stop_codon:yes gene_type:complete
MDALKIDVEAQAVDVQKVLRGQMALPAGFELGAPDPGDPKDNQIKMWLRPEWADRYMWSTVYHLVAILKHHYGVQQVVGLARGGTPFATMYANHQGIENVIYPKVTSYRQGTEQGEIEHNIGPELIESQGAHTLVLDDLVDNGTTVALARKLLPKAYIATAFHKGKANNVLPDGTKIVNFRGKLIPDIWTIFPWEKQMIKFFIPVAATDLLTANMAYLHNKDLERLRKEASVLRDL